MDIAFLLKADNFPLALEPVGQSYRLRADVLLSFNYQYSRVWAVRSLVDAPFSILPNEVK